MARGIDTIQRVDANVSKNLYAAGIRFVGRYGSRFTEMPEKVLHGPELAAICGAGLDVVLVYEDAPTSDDYWRPGRGTEDAEWALGHAKGLGMPAGAAYYASIDYDAGANVDDAIARYFGEWRAVMNAGGRGPYPCGAYGPGARLASLIDRGIIEYAWLSQSMRFDGTMQFRESGRANILQMLPSQAPVAVAGLSDYDPNFSSESRGGGGFRI